MCFANDWEEENEVEETNHAHKILKWNHGKGISERFSVPRLCSFLWNNIIWEPRSAEKRRRELELQEMTLVTQINASIFRSLIWLFLDMLTLEEHRYLQDISWPTRSENKFDIIRGARKKNTVFNI